MRPRLAVLCLLLAALGLLGGCGRAETAHNSLSRTVSPTMTSDGMDGGIEAPEPASYLQHLP